MVDCKILFITPGCFDKGGISRYSRYQIQALRTIFGDENVRVFSLMGPDKMGFEVPLSVYWHGAAGEARLSSRVAMSLRLLREAIIWRPNIIHSAHVNFSPLVQMLGHISGAATLLSVYGVELWSGLSAVRKRAMAGHSHVIADCHATADYVEANGMHPMRPTVIWDCVDLERFTPGPPDLALADRYGLPDPALHPIVMTLGRLCVKARHKGYDRLIHSFARLLPEIPSARLVIAGTGNDQGHLQRLAQEEGISRQVIFTGAIEEDHLPYIYRYANVFSLVSDFGHERGEGLPLTPIEALACGAPVVVGDEDGSREAVDNERNGLIVSPRKPDDLTDALLRLLTEDPGLRRREARSVAEERFGYAAFETKHRQIYKKFLEA